VTCAIGSSVKTTPLLQGDQNFLTSNAFLPIFRAIDAQRGGLHLFFGHHKQWGPSAKMVKNPTLSD
jgi:hypothetical protein